MKNINKSDIILASDQWLKSKKQRMWNLLNIALPDEALYRELMLSLGYPKNKVQFLELALLMPYSEIRKYQSQALITQALLYRAGFSDNHSQLPVEFERSLRMDKSVWIYKGTRPANFPEKRIKGISYLLAETLSSGLVNYFIEKIKSQQATQNPKIALKKIMDFEGIGINRKEQMFFNIIFPFILVYTREESISKFLLVLFEKYPPLKENSLIKKYLNENELEVSNVKEYMGLIYMLKTIN